MTVVTIGGIVALVSAFTALLSVYFPVVVFCFNLTIILSAILLINLSR